MKQIKPTFQAIHEQPLGPLNPLGVKLRAPIAVEVFEASPGKWRARRPGTSSLFDIPAQSDHHSLRDALTPHYFEKRLTEWTICYNGEPLQKGAYVVKTDGRIFLLEGTDFTHILQPAAESAGPAEDRKKAMAACGNSYAFDCFASYHAGPPPTCEVCRDTYDEQKAKP